MILPTFDYSPNKTKKLPSPQSVSRPGMHVTAVHAFTLVEILVVIAIIAVLASILLGVTQTAKKTAAQTKSLAVIRTVTAANLSYATDNNGQINTLRWGGDPLEGQKGQWVGDTFWGRMQPYIFTNLKTSNQSTLNKDLLSNMKQLFGTSDMRTLPGTPFAGTSTYYDTSGLPVPFSFNKYLYPWGNWARQQQLARLSTTAYITYGWAFFDETQAQAYQKLPAKPIYFLPSQKAIIGFLDGHVDSVAPPMAKWTIDINAPGV